MKKKLKWIILGVVVAFIIGYLCMPKDESMAYASESVYRGDVATYYSFSGNVAANNRQDYYATKELIVEEYYVQNGDYVEVGDLLYKVQKSSIQDSLTQAESALQMAKNSYQTNVKTVENQTYSLESSMELAKRSFEMAEKNYNNYLRLFEIGGVSKLEVDSQETAYMQAMANYKNAKIAYETYVNVTAPTTLSSAKASLDSAKASYNTTMDALGDLEVRAEINGEVTFCANDVGIKISQGKPIVTITDFDSLTASIKVDEYDISSVDIGKEAEVYVSSLGESISGVISNISKNASTMSGIAFFAAEVSFPKTEYVLEGMSVEVKMLNEQALNTLLLPITTISFTDHNEPYVLVKEGDKLVERAITIGISNGVIAEITSGLEEGEVVYYIDNLFTQAMMQGGR